jgi:hypothetical protein
VLLRLVADAFAANPDPCGPRDVVDWFYLRRDELPAFYSIVQVMGLLQPSSAAMERVFSLLSSFTDLQNSSLSDYYSLSCMLRYNKTLGVSG